MRDAQNEGFVIGGEVPTAQPYAKIMALRDGAVSYVGFVGNVRFGCGDTEDFHRLDYEKYISGAEDYSVPAGE